MTTATLLPPGPLQAERVDDGRRRLIRDLVVDLGVDLPELHTVSRPRRVYLSEHRTTIVHVPAGFLTDYSSVPGPAWFVGRFDQHDVAGVVHDALVYWFAPEAAAAEAWRIVARSGTRRVNAVQGFAGWLGLRVWGLFVYRPRLRARRP